MPLRCRNHRRLARAGGGGAVRDAAARGSRRARDQDRAAGRRRLRARLRHHRQRPVELLRLAESIEGIAHARSEAAGRRATSSRGCSSAPTCSCRTSRPAPPTGSARPPAELRARYPRLIVCNVSGYGSSGPYAREEGVRPAGAERGRPALDHRDRRSRRRGSASRSPTSPPGMYAYSGILTALLARATTGRGATVDVSLFDALGEWMGCAGVLHGLRRRAAAAQRPGPRVDRAVRSVRDRRRRPGLSRHPERARVDAVLRGRAAASRTSPTTRGSARTRCASRIGRRCTTAIESRRSPR